MIEYELNRIEKEFHKFNKDVEKVKTVEYICNNILCMSTQKLIVGNGGSAAIASHVAEDFTKIAKVSMRTFNDASFITCFANDFGWDQWVAQAILHSRFTKGDIGIFVSSSGESKNIVNGCQMAKDLGMIAVTFTGFDKNNTLNSMGDYNIHIPNHAYNVVEIIHESILLSMCDYMARI
jgi:D-sedoheptulose 7-phosphate isomerase